MINVSILFESDLHPITFEHNIKVDARKFIGRGSAEIFAMMDPKITAQWLSEARSVFQMNNSLKQVSTSDYANALTLMVNFSNDNELCFLYPEFVWTEDKIELFFNHLIDITTKKIIVVTYSSKVLEVLRNNRHITITVYRDDKMEIFS